MASNLVIKVSADTKDAAKKLKELGYNVEEVKKSTDRATEAQNLWNKTIKKGTDDNIKHLVELGAKFTSIVGVISLVTKGIKSSIDEAVKQNEEAAKTVEKVNQAWKDVKANLGSALLDTVSPALEELYGWLVKIADWQKNYVKTPTTADILGRATNVKNGASLVSDYSIEELIQARTYHMNHMGTEGWQATMDVLNDVIIGYAEIEDGLRTSLAHGQKVAESIAARNRTEPYVDNGTALNWGKSNEATYWEQYGLHIARQGDRQIAESLTNYYARYGANLSGQPSDDGRAAARNKWGFYSGNYSVELGKYLDKSGTYYWDEQVSAWKLVTELAEKTEDILERSQMTWQDYFSGIADGAMSMFSAITGAMDTFYGEEIAQIEASTLAEEDKADAINNIKEKQFNANKANAASQAAIDMASAIMNIWASNAGHPVYNSILTGMASATGAIQIGAILGQQYHPFAQGGIVSSPTHALIGEGGEKEAIMPLSKLQDFVTPSQGGTINITVNVADGTRGGNVAEDVYYAIERAQRTGLLPRWRYAS